MTFGIFQDFYSQESTFKGPMSTTGVVGTTMNGVMYLTIPVLSTMLDNGRWAKWRHWVAIAGACISSVAFLATSFSTEVWHLILCQGVAAALGGAMLYAPTTLMIDEWFKGGNRATAWGVQLSSKNLVGTGCPFMIYGLLNSLGFRWTLRIWAGIVLVTGLLSLFMIPKAAPQQAMRSRRIPWSFLKHRTFYIYFIANAIFSSGYGLPQTYLSAYASGVLHLSNILGALMIVLFNAPGIVSSVGFGVLSDKFSISASNNTFISAMGSCLCAFLLWGLKSHQVPALLILFAMGYGFFAGGYSATWGGWIKELEREAADKNEAINSGMIYGLMNGARGIGYTVGGLAGVELLKVGGIEHSQKWAYGTRYGSLILFTAISALLGGWDSAWKAGSGVRRCWRAIIE